LDLNNATLINLKNLLYNYRISISTPVVFLGIGRKYNVANIYLIHYIIVIPVVLLGISSNGFFNFKQWYGMKTATRINTELAIIMNTKGLRKPLALYFLIKSKYKHTIIYNVNYNKIGNITGLNPKTAKKYISQLKSLGLVKFVDNNLLFIGLNKVKEKFDIHTPDVYVETRPWTKFKGMLDRIDYSIIKNNGRQQDYRRALRSEQLKGTILDGREKSKVEKAKKENGLDTDDKNAFTEKNTDIRFSSRQLSKLLGISHTSANLQLRSLQNKGYLQVKQKIEKIKDMIFDENSIGYINMLNKVSPGYYFFNRGKLYQHLGVSLFFLV